MNKTKTFFAQLKWAWQRLYRGWDDRVTWSIDWYLAKMMPVWLRQLKERKHSIPYAILDDMIAGFEAAQRILGFEDELREQDTDRAIFDKGMNLFTEHFFSLWD